MDVVLKVNMNNPCGDGNVVYLDCINVNILMMILHSNFARYYHGGKLGKGYA